jgi:two-component system NarL family sensor kinase
MAIDPLRLPSEMEGDLFRITQEAVMNAVRHGGAKEVRIALTRSRDELTLTIEDDGTGFDGVDPFEPGEPGHLGLAGMRERAELMRGRLSIDSSEQGSRVTLVAPCPR